MGTSDLELIDAIRKEIIAFQELYKRYADPMYRNILVRVNSSFDTDDIFQDFFYFFCPAQFFFNINLRFFSVLFRLFFKFFGLDNASICHCIENTDQKD